jgi:hypothetical protein
MPRGELPEGGFTPREAQISGPDLTMLELVLGGGLMQGMENDVLPALPSSNGARKLVDAAYFYTQARYCIIDWTQLSEWHQDREAIAYVTTRDPVPVQTGKTPAPLLDLRNISD